MDRENEGTHMLKRERLFHRYAVDMYVKIAIYEVEPHQIPN